MKVRRVGFIYFLPGVCIAVAIGILSTSCSVQLPVSVVSIDKLEHFAAYFSLTFAFLWGFWKRGMQSRNIIWMVAIGCSGYGILLEFIQFTYFPQRFFELLDIVANICGAIASVFLLRYFVIKTS